MTWQWLAEGLLQKMQGVVEHDTVKYTLSLGTHLFSLNDLLGKQLRLDFSGRIFCQACGKRTAKSYGQGFCYPCFTTLACCDLCMMSPERCHYQEGTCREPVWAEQFCMADHIVYLANSSGLKVGITRLTQTPTRWIDQGARQALPIFRVSTRQQSGLIESALKADVADKTNWRTLLKTKAPFIDLIAARDTLLSAHYKMIDELQARFGVQAIQVIEQAKPLEFNYPVHKYPCKIVSFNLDKTPVVEGKLEGIKGQYLLFDTGVINIRKYTGYQVIFSVL